MNLKWLWAFVDMLFILAAVLGACVYALSVNVNPKAKPTEEQAKPPGQMMVCMNWVGHSDVDLWFRPAGQEKATGYSNKNGGTADLLVDDLGTEDIPHIECQFASSLPDGLWVINVHGYSVKDKPVSVHVVARMGGTKLIEETMDIRQAQERTVAQFRLQDGKVVPGSVNQVAVPLRSAGK